MWLHPLSFIILVKLQYKSLFDKQENITDYKRMRANDLKGSHFKPARLVSQVGKIGVTEKERKLHHVKGLELLLLISYAKAIFEICNL